MMCRYFLILLLCVLANLSTAYARQDFHRWMYRDYTDAKSGDHIYTAVKSADEITKTPSGDTVAKLMLMTNKVRSMIELDIVLATGTQMVDCTKKCTMKAQLDNQEINITVTSGANSNIIAAQNQEMYLEPAADILKGMQSAERLRIIVPIKGEGDFPYDFDLRDLKWPPE